MNIKSEPYHFYFYSYPATFQFGELSDSYGESTYDLSNNPAVQIVINSDIKSQHCVRSTILHELFESAILLQGCIYTPIDQNKERTFFMFDHHELDIMTEQIYLAYDQIIAYIESDVDITSDIGIQQ